MRLHEALRRAQLEAVELGVVVILSRGGLYEQVKEGRVASYQGDGHEGDFAYFAGCYRPMTVSKASRRWSPLMGWTDAHVLADDWIVEVRLLSEMGTQLRGIVAQVRARRAAGVDAGRDRDERLAKRRDEP